MAGRYEKSRSMLAKFKQQHLLDFYNQLDENQKRLLLEQIEHLDMERIPYWVEMYVRTEVPSKLLGLIKPAPFYPAVPKTPDITEKFAHARKTGVDCIAGGKVAAFVVAGGQGTRLGYDGPKGNYPISPVRNKTLFRIFAEAITAAQNKYGHRIPWYVMTSPINHEATLEIFRSNNFYGLDSSDVFIFQQGTIVNFDCTGRILLSDKGRLAVSPDGHGGSIRALAESGAVADMKKRGIEYLSYWQVDNPLVKVIDPLFIGLHVLDGSEMSSKGLAKAYPLEKVGNFCLADGKTTVIEYSDLPNELTQKRRKNGTLLFELGSIGIHVISVSFVERFNKTGLELPLHRALKKIPYIDAKGTLIQPDKPNGIKLEAFIFDAIPMAQKAVVLETIRMEEFAPVKNATGDDSADVTRKMIIERAASWLEAAGVKVPRRADGSCDCVIEMSAGFALDKEDVPDKTGTIAAIKPGQQVYLD